MHVGIGFCFFIANPQRVLAIGDDCSHMLGGMVEFRDQIWMGEYGMSDGMKKVEQVRKLAKKMGVQLETVTSWLYGEVDVRVTRSKAKMKKFEKKYNKIFFYEDE